MDDLTQILRDLNGRAMTHRVYYTTDPDTGRETTAEVFAGYLHARFAYRDCWHLTRGTWSQRPETITGLLNSIKEA